MAASAAFKEPNSSQSSAPTGTILLIAALLGLTAGLFLSVSPVVQKWAGLDTSRPLRVALPEVRVASPSLDVLKTSDAPESRTNAQESGTQISPEAGAAPSAEASGRAQQQSGATSIPTRPGGMLALDYDLAEFAAANSTSGSSDGNIETSMPLLVDGVESGTAKIQVADNAQILIATSSVARAVGARASALSPRLSSALESGSGYLPFYELRAAGIDVQYDPIRDRLALTLPS